MASFTAGGKTVSVYPCTQPDRPVIYLNTFGQEGEQVAGLLWDAGCPPVTLVCICNLQWNHDMAPWDIPPLSRRSEPCTGGADGYLDLLLGEILPAAERAVPGKPAWRGIAGYSLAGLFAVYASCKTDVFSRVASMSGSLWYPGIREYLFANGPKHLPKRMYFSLGDKEHRTRNRMLQCVEQNTREIHAFYRQQGVDTVFRLNPGNHFQQAAERTAAGILWLAQERQPDRPDEESSS